MKNTRRIRICSRHRVPGETWDPDGFRRLHDRIIKEIGAEHVRFS